MIEIIAAAGAAALAVITILWQMLGRARRQRDDARRQADTATEVIDHATRTRAAADAARQETERQVDSVRETARQGRRDHFESDR